MHQEEGGESPGNLPCETKRPYCIRLFCNNTVVMASKKVMEALNTVSKKLSKDQLTGIVYTASPLFSNDRVLTLVELCTELQPCCDNCEDAVLLISVILELIGERKYVETLRQSVTGPIRSTLEEFIYIEKEAIQKVKLRGLIVRMCRKLGPGRLDSFARNLCLQLSIHYDNCPGFELFKYLENAGHVRADSPDGLSVIMSVLDSDSEFKAVADFMEKGDDF